MKLEQLKGPVLFRQNGHFSAKFGHNKHNCLYFCPLTEEPFLKNFLNLSFFSLKKEKVLVKCQGKVHKKGKVLLHLDTSMTESGSDSQKIP